MFEIRHEKMNDLPDTRQAYNKIFQSSGILHKDSLYNWIIDLIRPESDRRLLDVACGEGRLVTLAQRRGLQAIGIDFAIKGVYIGSMEASDTDWIVGDGEKLPIADTSIDYITNVGSLEHYISPEDGLAEMARILKKGGRACILVPNAFGLFGNILYVARKGDIFDDGQPLQRYGTRRTWENMLESVGLHVDRVLGYSEIPQAPPRTLHDFIWLVSHPLKIVRYLITSIMPVNLTNHFVFLCSK
jgi:SAM-dependent methyltransferase